MGRTSKGKNSNYSFKKLFTEESVGKTLILNSTQETISWGLEYSEKAKEQELQEIFEEWRTKEKKSLNTSRSNKKLRAAKKSFTEFKTKAKPQIGKLDYKVQRLGGLGRFASRAGAVGTGVGVGVDAYKYGWKNSALINTLPIALGIAAATGGVGLPVSLAVMGLGIAYQEIVRNQLEHGDYYTRIKKYLSSKKGKTFTTPRPKKKLPYWPNTTMGPTPQPSMGSYYHQDTTPMISYNGTAIPVLPATGGHVAGSGTANLTPEQIEALTKLGVAGVKGAGKVGSAVAEGAKKFGSWIASFFAKKSVQGKILHSGGKVPGRKEVMAILRGGETVRTEGQEAVLQEELQKKQDPVIPLGAQNKRKSESKAPVCGDFTKQDEQYIISIIADAYRRNRMGFRKALS